MIPPGMVEVSRSKFFHALNADPRDVMPSVVDRDCTWWETDSRHVWGWSFPGWANPRGETVYAIAKTQEIEARP